MNWLNRDISLQIRICEFMLKANMYFKEIPIKIKINTLSTTNFLKIRPIRILILVLGIKRLVFLLSIKHTLIVHRLDTMFIGGDGCCH